MYQQEHVGRTDITLLFVNSKTLKSKDKIIHILIFDTSLIKEHQEKELKY